MRELKAIEQFSIGLIFFGLGVGLFAQGAQTTLLLAGLGGLSLTEFARWILEDVGKLESSFQKGHPARRLLRLTSPKFWAFPFYLVTLANVVPPLIAGLGILTLTVAHLSFLRTFRD